MKIPIYSLLWTEPVPTINVYYPPSPMIQFPRPREWQDLRRRGLLKVTFRLQKDRTGGYEYREVVGKRPPALIPFPQTDEEVKPNEGNL